MELDIVVISNNVEKINFLQSILDGTSLTIKQFTNINNFEDVGINFKKNKPDIIFLDTEVDNTAKANLDNLLLINTTTPIIVITNATKTADAFLYLDNGAADFLIHDKYDELLLEKSIKLAIKGKIVEESLKFSNTRYEITSKATSDMIWDWDLLKNNIFRSEDGWYKILGETKANEHQHPDSWRDRVHPQDLKNCEAILSKILKAKDVTYFEMEYRIRRYNNEYATIIDKGYALRNQAGQVVRLIGASIDITDKKMLELQLVNEIKKTQNEITKAVITAQEQERESLGRELHDNINQILTTSKLYIEFSIANEAMRNDLLQNAKQFIETAVAEIRNLTKALMPPTIGETGLKMAIKELLEKILKVNAFTINVDDENIKEQHLKEDLKLTLFRIIQEQLTNISKHSYASKVWITFMQTKTALTLTIKDNGIGFNSTAYTNGVGIKNMQSRAQLHNGQFKLISKDDEGCILTVNFKI